MTEERFILMPDKLEELKGLLVPNLGYTDQELQDAAYVFIATPLVAGEAIKAADADMLTIASVAMIAVPVIAAYINLGIIDPANCKKHLDEVAERYKA